MNNVYLLLATLAGAGLAVQAAVNTQLRVAANSALGAAAITATLAAVILSGAELIARDGFRMPALSQHPWWIWLGGVMGAFYVFAIVALTTRLGVALVFTAIVVGQLVTGLIADHYGWFGVAVVRLSPTRAIGALLLLAGMVLIRWR